MGLGQNEVVITTHIVGQGGMIEVMRRVLRRRLEEGIEAETGMGLQIGTTATEVTEATMTGEGTGRLRTDGFLLQSAKLPRSPPPLRRPPSPKRIKLEIQPSRPRSITPPPLRQGGSHDTPRVKTEPEDPKSAQASPKPSQVNIKREEAARSPLLPTEPKERSPMIPSSSRTTPQVKSEPAQSLLPPTGIKREIPTKPRQDRDGDIQMSDSAQVSKTVNRSDKPLLQEKDKPPPPLNPKNSPPRGPRYGPRQSQIPPDVVDEPTSATASPVIPSTPHILERPKWNYTKPVEIKQEWADVVRERENIAVKTLTAVKAVLTFSNLKQELAQALYEVELANLDVEAAERRRKIAAMQLEKATDGTFVPEYPDPSQTPSLDATTEL
ncbi:hypothetical protein ONZ45_g3196 [Pleurotus djamor]|nr:hypothetical protein ONZ45_g3196 [Pleurotus djamor]